MNAPMTKFAIMRANRDTLDLWNHWVEQNQRLGGFVWNAGSAVISAPPSTFHSDRNIASYKWYKPKDIS